MKAGLILLLFLVLRGIAQTDSGDIDFKKEFDAIDGSQKPFTVATQMYFVLQKARHESIDQAESLLDTIHSYIQFHDLKLIEARYFAEVAEIARVKNRLDEMIEYYGKAIVIFEDFQKNYPDSNKYEVTYSIGGFYNNLADGYIVLNKYEEALNFYMKSLKAVLPLNDSLQNSIRYYNISDTYVSLNEPDSAMKYILLCKEMEDGMGMPDGLAYAHDGLAKVYVMKGQYGHALAECDTAVNYASQVNDPYFQIEIQQQKAKVLFKWGKSNMAKEEYLAIMEKASEIGYKLAVEDSYYYLKSIYEKLGDYKEAYKYADLLLVLSDSTLQQKAAEKALEFEIQYQTELKDAEILSLNKQKKLTDQLNAELEEKRKLEENKSRIVTAALIGGLIFLLLIGGIIIRNSRKNALLNENLKRSNEDLSDKNKEIQTQASEINDSISYAMNIQGALFPNEHEFSILGKDRFVLFSPKDIVSGDFYWTFRSERLDLNYLAVADCTGHGVPGAFMSILGVSLLDKIVIKLTDLSTNRILTELNHELYKNLSAGGLHGVRDGMDIALIAIDENNKQVHFSGARNRAIHVSDGIVKEYKGDRVDLGRKEPCSVIQEQTFSYKDGDMVYLFTDGYVDQKGSASGKKFYMQPFRDTLMEVANLGVEEQKKKLESIFLEWKGDKFDQMDDVLVVGVKL